MAGRALVTGASSGVGAALARQLAARGYEVVLVGRDRGRLDAVAAGLPCPPRVVVADLADEQGLRAVEAVLRAGPVDLLVNSAAVGVHGPFAEHDPTALAATVAVNVTATVRLSRVALEGMSARGRGGVISVSSLAGSAPQPGMATYSATKAFVDSWMSSVGAELRGSGITLTCARPGWVRTAFHTRSGQPVDHVAEADWLAPDTVAERILAAHDRGRASVVILPDVPPVPAVVRGARRRARALLRALTGA